MACGRLCLVDRTADLGIVDMRQRLPDEIAGHLGQAGADIAAVAAEFAIDQPRYVRPILGRNPPALRENVCKRPLFLGGPQGTTVNELRPRDRVGLQGNHAEKEIEVSAGTSHALALWSGTALP